MKKKKHRERKSLSYTGRYLLYYTSCAKSARELNRFQLDGIFIVFNEPGEFAFIFFHFNCRTYALACRYLLYTSYPFTMIIIIVPKPPPPPPPYYDDSTNFASVVHTTVIIIIILPIAGL